MGALRIRDGCTPAMGGYATVYRATLDGRDVALKVDGGRRGRDRKALKREYDALCVLGGPHFPRVHALQRAWAPLRPQIHGRYYLAMDYVEGPTLREVIESGRPLGERATWRLAMQAACALVQLRCAGLVHRDLHPGNLILHEGRLVIVDLGLAGPIDAPYVPGAITNGYEPPCAPSARAADVYMLAMSLAHACYGARYWQGGLPCANDLPTSLLGRCLARCIGLSTSEAGARVGC